MKLSKWTHPQTGEIRIYVNGIGFGIKAYIVESDEFYCGFDIKVYIDYDVTGSRKDDIINKIAEIIDDRSFDQICEIAN